MRLSWPAALVQLSVQKVTAWIFESSAVAPLKINKTTHKSPSYRGIKPCKLRRQHSHQCHRPYLTLTAKFSLKYRATVMAAEQTLEQIPQRNCIVLLQKSASTVPTGFWRIMSPRVRLLTVLSPTRGWMQQSGAEAPTTAAAMAQQSGSLTPTNVAEKQIKLHPNKCVGG